ncbi:hypothetical protein D9758_013785 [Tetrapyrgos nigripes]|uniref:DUF659 domain-containing protein n=1 Tax=Tetrapyrgos nigripes TaxID=182062 RepID=A0A8H5FXP4_9AGAR|nr:hypothetical protein D9758_013785 [Tetrapyrgos nigripes]
MKQQSSKRKECTQSQTIENGDLQVWRYTTPHSVDIENEHGPYEETIFLLQGIIYEQELPPVGLVSGAHGCKQVPYLQQHIGILGLGLPYMTAATNQLHHLFSKFQCALTSHSLNPWKPDTSFGSGHVGVTASCQYFTHKAKYKTNKFHHKSFCKYCVLRVVAVKVDKENCAFSDGRIRKVRDVPVIETESAVLPGRDVLSGCILNEEVGKAEAETRVEVNGHFGTGQSDGWKNVTKNSLITAMVNVEYKTHLLNVTDISSQLKTVEMLLSIILKEIDHVQTILMVTLIAWCTDCSGESLKMRCLLWEHFDWIVVLDCWAHQFNLVVSNIFKLKLPVVKVTDQALESHSIALGLLNDEQSRINSAVVLILILPVLTCWMSHYLSMDHLLLLELPLRQMILIEPIKLALIKAAGQKRLAKAKAQQILRLLGREDFWRNLKSYPLCLYRCAIHASLEKCWKKVDQEVFILAVIFNPFIQQCAFKSGGPFHSTADRWHVICWVFRQFYGRTPDAKFHKAFTKYMAGTGKWSHEMMDLDYFCQDAKEWLSLTEMQPDTYVNIVQIWEEHLMSSDKNDVSGVNGMVVLATRIMSMVPNSAGIEQRFSKFGAVHTKPQDLVITVLDDHIQQKHGTQPHYECSHGQSKDAQDISAATTGAVAAPRATAQPAIHEELGVLDINDEDGNRAGEGEGDAGDVGEPEDMMDILSFEQTVEGLLEDEAWGEEYGPDDLMPDQPLDEEALKLENLFDYPSLSDTDNQTFAFMMEFWQHRESGLRADTTRHETLTSKLGSIGSIDDSDNDNSI